jgi:BON domain
MRKVFLALLAAALPAISALAGSPAEEQMAHRIGNQLKQSGLLRNYEIGVKYHDGVVCLEGKVTSPEQRAAAVRLAQKVKGVSRVECKLEIQNDAKSDGENDYTLASATEPGSPDDSQSESSGITHAYEQRPEQGSMPRQQQTIANNPRTSGMRQRNNMPLPSRQMPSMMPVRQANAMGVNQAGCQGCNVGGAPMGAGMGGPGMCGPGMGGAGMCGPGMGGPGACGPGMGDGAPMGFVPQGGRGVSTDNPNMPGYAWPSYASYPNYAALSYPQQYSPTAWPYIGPFYPYPQVPLAWRKVSLEWDDGWWFLDFSSHNSSH